MITDEELNEIKSRCLLATPGPWTSFIEGRDHYGGSSFIMVGEEDDRSDDIEMFGATNADQDFIANARQDIPKLITEIERLRGLLSTLSKS